MKKKYILIAFAGVFGFHPLQAVEAKAFVENGVAVEEAQRASLPMRLHLVSTGYTISYKDANGEFTKGFAYREGCEIFIDINLSSKTIVVYGKDTNGKSFRQRFSITSILANENGGMNTYVKYLVKDTKGNAANIVQIGISEPEKLTIDYGNESRMYYVEIPDV